MIRVPARGAPAAAIAARISAAGHRDGVRRAAGEIAPEAERRGVHLYLAPEVAADAGSRSPSRHRRRR